MNTQIYRRSISSTPCLAVSATKKTVPKLYLNQFTEKLSEKIPTNELFVKFGFLNNPKAGLVHWLPIGLSVLNKVKSVVNNRLQEAGCQETSLSILSHSSLWQKSGRWNNSELFKLKDGNGQDFCLTATSEEEITTLVKNSVTSYKELPLIYYQIHEKFRDEKRPRMGLLRSREFLMKDAYSFDIDEQSAMESYETMVEVYHKIFQDLRIPYTKAVADSGDIGGSLSHEWHYLDKSGEDTLFSCSNCHDVSNLEKTFSLPKMAAKTEGADVSADDSSKSTKYFSLGDRSIRVVYPSSREFDINLLKHKYPEAVEIDTIESSTEIETVFDTRLDINGTPVVTAEEGEICFGCKEGYLTKTRAIEVGHTFYLGTKYSKPLELSIPVPEGNKLVERDVVMGCYGIGLSRIIASIAEITRDKKGFRWPAIISPWNITIIEANSLKEDVGELYQHLNEQQVDYKVDDRPSVTLNKKINDSNMIGVPLVMILGKTYPLIEIEVRGQRFSNQWQQAYQNKQFEWQVEHSKGIEKHIVHRDQLHTVIESLLKDM